MDETIFRLLAAGIEGKVKRSPKLMMSLVAARLFNLQNQTRSQKVADVHYNLDNDLYSRMLGPSMSYTCAYWRKARKLDTAQDHKHYLICRKIGLKPGDKVLELGCGWGGFAEYAAKHYGAELTSINISKEQVAYGRERCKEGIREASAFGQAFVKGIFQHATVMHSTFGFLMQI